MLNRTATPYNKLSFDAYSERVKGKTIKNDQVKEEAGNLFDASPKYSFAYYIL